MWISLAEQKPDDGQCVLVNPPFYNKYFDSYQYVMIWCKRYDNGNGKLIYYQHDCIHEAYGDNQPTHWMSLPDYKL